MALQVCLIIFVTKVRVPNTVDTRTFLGNKFLQKVFLEDKNWEITVKLMHLLEF